ncbi:DUF99 family protein [Candidatus Bathyarchaeota archaeon]|nr:DUF99 family protein [Candidatus Bathyarchaeota archaeon]
MKKEIRIIGFEDGDFNYKSVIGVVFRGGLWLEGLIKFNVESNSNITEKLSKALKNSPHFKQLRVIMLSKNVLAGEKIDLQRLYEATKLPVIVAYKKRISNNKDIFSVKVKGRKIYASVIGLSKDSAKEVLRNSSIKTGFPEPLKAAFLIAKAFNSLKHKHEKI